MFLFSRYQFKYTVEGELLRITYSGKVRKKEMDEIMSRIYKLIKENGTKKILIDALKSNVIMELAESIDYTKAYPPEYKQAKIAVVEKPEKREQYSVHQVFADNEAMHMKFFNAIPEAENWLAT